MRAHPAKKLILCLSVFAVLVVFCPWRHNCWAADAVKILEQVHQRYTQGDFEADFVQEAHLKAMDMVDTARGRVYFSPPQMMRWHYVQPEEYFIITDGNTVWMYKPQDRQVMRGRAKDYFGKDRGADYFTNPKELTKAFMIEVDTGRLEDQGHHVLKLLPKTPRPELAALYLFISKEKAEITKTVTENSFGDRTTLRFSCYKYNQGLDQSLFTFDIPKGVEVIEFGNDPFR